LNQHALSLLAISIGAVFFGAATYIGNGPNFMVKAVADQQKIRMPTFMGFVLNSRCHSCCPCCWPSGSFSFVVEKSRNP